ncbi:DUF1048 domain-containing protein [Sphingosinicella rhizophila]|uniref:DUF1048 domain-containing protein n=1 Tax=Sphingosinicella rhizophila TaxID=3050082 RepID=A0ABU3Q5R1_9SPHN|nr:DUF1048 domain-containing protein [Sphingosinicella sp. GR2756]MDT9598736.1 DUF1048 domain-containing protein [Sphingosinicella sp. GR2756]
MSILSDLALKLIGDKKRWRAYKARVRNLPDNYREAVDAFERYLMFSGPGDADNAASLLENIADLFEQSAADGIPIRDIVGNDPVEFIEEMIRNYPQGDWRLRERQRLTESVNRAAQNQS